MITLWSIHEKLIDFLTFQCSISKFYILQRMTTQCEHIHCYVDSICLPVIHYEFFIMISWNRFYHFPKIISIFQSSNVRFFFAIWNTIIIFERAKINIKINLKILDLNARKQVRKSKNFQDGMSCMYVCCFTSNLVKTICFCDILKLFKSKFIQRTNPITLHIKICMKDEYYNSTSRLQFSRSEHERFK